MIVLRLIVYLLACDATVIQSRKGGSSAWVKRTRLYAIMSSAPSTSTDPDAGVNNHAILEAIDAILMLWKRVYDSDESKPDGDDARETCVATVRLLEMLVGVTDQLENCLHRILYHVADFSRPSRCTFLHTLQEPYVKTFLATLYLGKMVTSRSKEHEWFHAIVEGLAGMKYKPWAGAATVNDDNFIKDLKHFAGMHAETFLRRKSAKSVVSGIFKAVLSK
ncbi:hypothetical protein SPRG_06862 [Saprolegnia parasitica CBS 223.65]|uniref:Uncharacterized protein n=1 Tax=Saprolegnia parasitica (strain CBS 223.65) TaxID=695850 RepID=A0A067CA07_SAPPC|nr:hypothetical protein SPRG_06862 [Saprolegnia parasitica CBS 223.65]KDO27594.1 hypothetical protein SPRG_06862 [Saprolegnia parasitica CBS 223.65]|eukprot:XP_012201718.1 hypothetical protein SPRG_06862 [Saprolegnia parasitica CBS 223.65]